MELEEIVEIEVEPEKIGPQGLSAYEVYVQNGGTLTEQEWLSSLKGEKGDKGEQGEPGAIKMQVVDTLPETGFGDTIYLVPAEDVEEQNYYNEYLYNNGWELIGSTQVNLTDYATKEDLDKKQDILTAGENISIVDNVISASGGGSDVHTAYEIQLSSLTFYNKTYYYLNTEDAIRFGELITKIYSDGVSYPTIIIKDMYGYVGILKTGNPISTNLTSWYLSGTGSYTVSPNRPEYGIVEFAIGMAMQGSWTDNVFTCSTTSMILNAKHEYLSKTNTSSYTPTLDYNPATKKYVDDSVAALAGNENYVIYADYAPWNDSDYRIAYFENIINDLKQNKRVILMPTYNNSRANSTFACGIYTSPTITIDLDTYSGTLYFRDVSTYYSYSSYSGDILEWRNSKYIAITLTSGAVTEVTTETDYKYNYGTSSLASKSYVDGAITTAIGTALEGSY